MSGDAWKEGGIDTTGELIQTPVFLRHDAVYSISYALPVNDYDD